jgi:hypothetical protein
MAIKRETIRPGMKFIMLDQHGVIFKIIGIAVVKSRGASNNAHVVLYQYAEAAGEQEAITLATRADEFCAVTAEVQ